MQANIGPWLWQYRLSATKITKGQYSTVRLEQATCRLVSSLLHGTKQKNTQLMIISMAISIRPNPDQERTTQNAQIYHKTTMPYNNTKSSLSYDLFWNQGLILKKRCTVAHVQCFFLLLWRYWNAYRMVNEAERNSVVHATTLKILYRCCGCNISNTKDRVQPHFQTPRGELKRRWPT